MKVDFVNDVPFRWGTPQPHAVFFKVDTWRNILSNKLCALSRNEAKDLADLVFLARHYDFLLGRGDGGSQAKGFMGGEPLEICRMIHQFPLRLIATVRWTTDIDAEKFKEDIGRMHKDIFYGNPNSLASV